MPWHRQCDRAGGWNGTAVGGTEHAGSRSQVSCAEPGKVGWWRAGKRGNDPKRQTGNEGRPPPSRYKNGRWPRGTNRSSDRATSLPLARRSALPPPEISPLVSGLPPRLHHPASPFSIPHLSISTPRRAPPASASPRFLGPVLSSSRLALLRPS